MTSDNSPLTLVYMKPFIASIAANLAYLLAAPKNAEQDTTYEV